MAPMVGRPVVPRRISLAVVALAVALLGAACGIPQDSSPNHLDAADLPASLTSTPTTAARGHPQGVLVEIYFVEADRLVARSRVVAGPRDVTAALGALLDGPTLPEEASGISTAVSSGTTVLAVHVDKAHALIDLSSDFANTGGPDQILAIAQVVYTATWVAPVTSVSFELSDQPVSVPAANGTLVNGPVDRGDYASLLAPGQSEPPPASQPS